jgi:pimeloyl-ACP methyl ester carboxylesterase
MERSNQQQAQAMIEAVDRPMWLEAFAGAEWVALRFSAVYQGHGVPKGHGEPVVLVPGFLAGDDYFTEMRTWLRRIGYRPYTSDIGFNVGCPDKKADRLAARVSAIYEETGVTVTLIGHSLGGLIARAAAQRAPQAVRRVITLGSPLRGVRAHPVVLGLAQPESNGATSRAGCMTETCRCRFATSIRESRLDEGCEMWALYSKLDGVVDPAACEAWDPDRTREVRSTHTAMGMNVDVYRVVGEVLVA